MTDDPKAARRQTPLKRWPLATALTCLGLFLLLTSVPLDDWLQEAGASNELAQTVHSGLLAAFSWVALTAAGGGEGQRASLAIFAVLALAGTLIPHTGLYLSWCAFTGLGEETLFCGILYPCLRTAFSRSHAGAIATAVLFAVCHLTNSLPLPWVLARVALAFGFSLCMVWLYGKTKRLWAVVAVHATFDALFFIVAPLPL